MCLDHPEVQSLISKITDRRIVTYGSNPQAEVRYLDVEAKGANTHFAIARRDRKTGEIEQINNLVLPMPGLHNVSNATAAIGIALELGVSHDAIRKGLASFGGVKRRFTHTGSWQGVEIFDDYAHHPVEIKAVLAAAREAASGKVIAIKQPHRYTRLSDLFDEFCACFNDADTVLVAPVYAAGETEIAGINSEALAAGLVSGGHRHAVAIPGPEVIAEEISKIAKQGDFVIFLGAGNVTQWAYALPGELKALGASQ